MELGVSFKTDVSGYITGIRFYKSAGNTGTHVGNLWSSTGALLATATFTSETASGWQQVNFSNPVAITANTVYVASYHSAIGHWSVDYNYFASSGVDNAPLHALANVGGTPDGRYAWGSSSVFPASGIGANYWVDVAFLSAGGEGSTQTGQLTTSPTSLGFGCDRQRVCRQRNYNAIDTGGRTERFVERDFCAGVDWKRNRQHLAGEQRELLTNQHCAKRRWSAGQLDGNPSKRELRQRDGCGEQLADLYSVEPRERQRGDFPSQSDRYGVHLEWFDYSIDDRGGKQRHFQRSVLAHCRDQFHRFDIAGEQRPKLTAGD